MKAGLFAPVMKDEMAALEERRARLIELTRDQLEEPPLLHPGLAEIYRRKVETLTQALNKDELRSEAHSRGGQFCAPKHTLRPPRPP